MKKGKKLLVICPYPENVAPSQRLKFEQYYDFFREKGYEVEVSPFISLNFWKIIYKPGNFFKKLFYTIGGYLRRINDVIRAGKYDVVYIHLWATPLGPPFFEWLFKKTAKKIVYDIDDLVYLHRVKSKAHSIVNIFKGRKKPIYLMKIADHVITCTPYLDQFVRKYNTNTTDISSTVDIDKYKPVNEYSNEKKLVIGWSGSLSTSVYFYLLAEVLKTLKKKYDFDILVIGNKDVRIDGLNINAVDWSEQKEISLLQQIDIGLYPLPDEEWVLGKSGLKAIQYMALGIPTVAKAIGANFRVIENGVSGFLVATDKEWIEALEKLILDPSLRRKIGMEARRRVENLFSVQSNKDIYVDILDKLVEPVLKVHHRGML